MSRGGLCIPRVALLAALSPPPRSDGAPGSGEGLSAAGKLATRRGVTREAESAGGVNGLAEGRRGEGDGGCRGARSPR